MKKFAEKRRYPTYCIFLFLLGIDILWFGMLIFNRFFFAEGADGINGARQLGLFCIYFFSILLCIVLSGFELRLIDENRKRAIGVGTKIDCLARFGTFGSAMLLAALKVAVKDQIIAMACEFVLMAASECVLFVVLHRGEKVIIDWTNAFYQKRDCTKSEADVRYNCYLSFYFITVCGMIVFAIGFVAVPVWCIVGLAVLCAVSIVLLHLYLYRTRGEKNVLAIVGSGMVVPILTASYFICIYFLNLSYVFLLDDGNEFSQFIILKMS